MATLSLLLVAATFAGVWSDTCQQHARLPPLLVTSALPRTTVYVWPSDSVDLRCRPSQTGGCRWMKGSQQLGTDCRLTTSVKGTIKCLRGDQTVGSINVVRPPNQQVERGNLEHYHYYNRFWDYRGERYWSHKSSTFLCYSSGTIIPRKKLCDASKKCNGGEDEWNCSPACGPPSVGEHSTLSDLLEAYTDGSKVNYVCDSGFSFLETLSGVNRTCRAGRWSAPPPTCQPNRALNRTVRVTGQPLTDCSRAVDGALDTWCVLMPSGAQQALAVQLDDNVTITKVLVRSLTERYTVSLKLSDVQLDVSDELSCPCHKASDDGIHPEILGVRVCSCPEQPISGKRELVVHASTDTMSLPSIAEIGALEALITDEDQCKLLGHPAYGRFEPAGQGEVKLSCEPGHSPSCHDTVQCSAVQSGTIRLSCLAVSCPQPPVFPNTKIVYENGTNWRSLTEYDCIDGYALYPAHQPTTSSCDSEGLWSIGQISCLSETDIRVITFRLGQQHERSMAALRAELLAGQQRLLAEQNIMQHRLSKLEREMRLLGLADGAYLPAAEASGADPTRPQEQDVLQAMLLPLKAKVNLLLQEKYMQLEQQAEAYGEPEELDGEAAELGEEAAADELEGGSVVVELEGGAGAVELKGGAGAAELQRGGAELGEESDEVEEESTELD